MSCLLCVRPIFAVVGKEENFPIITDFEEDVKNNLLRVLDALRKSSYTNYKSAISFDATKCSLCTRCKFKVKQCSGILDQVDILQSNLKDFLDNFKLGLMDGIEQYCFSEGQTIMGPKSSVGATGSGYLRRDCMNLAQDLGLLESVCDDKVLQETHSPPPSLNICVESQTKEPEVSIQNFNQYQDKEVDTSETSTFEAPVPGPSSAVQSINRSRKPSQISLNEPGKKTATRVDVPEAASKYCCHVCKDFFKNRHDLRKHRKSTSHEGLQERTRRQCTDGAYECRLCQFPKSFSSRDDFRRHQRMHESQIVENPNNSSPLASVNAGTVQRKDAIDHRTELSYPSCCKRFRDRVALRGHVRRHHEGLLLSQVKSTGHEGKMKASAGPWTKFDSLIQRFQCTQCSLTFNKADTLTMHVKKVHTGIKKLVNCNICNKSFASNGKYRIHKSIVHGVDSESLDIEHDIIPPESITCVCEVCGKSFKHKFHLKVHSYLHREKKFSCEFPNCCKAFPRKCDLRQHQISHGEDRPFVCEKCGVSFKQYNRTHFRLHRSRCTGKASKKIKGLQTQERVWMCHKCGKSYKSHNSSNTNFRLHLRRCKGVAEESLEGRNSTLLLNCENHGQSRQNEEAHCSQQV